MKQSETTVAVNSEAVVSEIPLDRIAFALPDIGNEEITAVVDCLKSGWITTGPRTRDFEAAFAARLGVKHAVAVNSCTAALHLALEAVGVRPGDEVLIPAMTFAATAEIVHYLGAKPVLMDCDAATLNMDATALRSLLAQQFDPGPDGAINRVTGARVRAIVPVHYAGRLCDMEALVATARQFGMAVVEDTAHAFPAHAGGRPAGTFGDAGAFSFYATKTITTAEGGMLVTNDDAIADRARIMSLHGISRDAWLRYTAQGTWFYEILEPGFKYNMTDLAAALGLVQLRRADEMHAVRRRYASLYTNAFRAIPEIQTPDDAPSSDMHAWHLYPIRLNLETLRISRAQFVEELSARGVGASVHFIPLHLHPYYRETYGYRPEDLPVATAEYERLISLPIYPKMTLGQVERVIDTVVEIVRLNRH